MFPVIFCIFSLRCDHDLSLFYCPYQFTFFIFYYKKAQHSTQHTHSQTHTRTHTCTPATDRDLESGLSKSNTRKNPRKCLKMAKSGESLTKTRDNADGQIVRLRRSGDRPIESSDSWFPPKFPSFSREKANDLRNRERVVLDLFSNFKWLRSSTFSRWTPRASDNSTWTIYGKQKIGDEGRTTHRVKRLLHMLKNPCFLDKKCEVLSRETVFHWIGPLINDRSYSVKRRFSD